MHVELSGAAGAALFLQSQREGLPRGHGIDSPSSAVSLAVQPICVVN